MEIGSGTRKASHAGSWYTDDPEELMEELNGYLEKASKTVPEGTKLKGMIAPHAGYAYSGPTAAWSYINIEPTNYKRVFLLGPAHHKYLDGWALSYSGTLETPIGNIVVDKEIVQELADTGEFEWYSLGEEEDEHSLEMHLPYIKRMFGDHDFTIVPIVVGSIKYKTEQRFGKLLAKYVKDDDNLFIISSDFCHWGASFQYMPYEKSSGLDQSGYIEQLDKQGMDLIETQNGKKFVEYLQETDNTICGRHPITVFLEALKESGLDTVTKFVKYAQSSKIKHKYDTSVSYAASYTVINM